MVAGRPIAHHVRAGKVDLRITDFEAFPAFSHVTACLPAGSPYATLSIRSFEGYVGSAVAPIAAAWRDQLPGGSFTHREPAPLHGASGNPGCEDRELCWPGLGNRIESLERPAIVAGRTLPGKCRLKEHGR